MRNFFLMYNKYATPSPISGGQISQTVSAKSTIRQKTHEEKGTVLFIKRDEVSSIKKLAVPIAPACSIT